MDITQFSQINPPQRLLMGPGPINADPRVLRAMSSQLIGQYDPAMTHYMNEVMALYRGVFRTENRWTMLVDGTSRAGIEAILVSAIRPGDKVLVPVFGLFLGRRGSARLWLSMVIAVGGLYLLCMKNGFGGIEASDWILLSCAVLFSFQIMTVDYFAPQVDGVRLSLLQFFVVAVESTAAALLFENPTLAEFGANWLPLAYCGVMSSGVAYTLQILGQRDVNPAIASLIMCLESVFSALGGWLLLHQSLSMREVFGCTLIFAAVILAQLPVEDWLKCRSASRK